MGFFDGVKIDFKKSANLGKLYLPILERIPYLWNYNTMMN